VDQNRRSTFALPLTYLALGLLACRVGTEPTAAPPFSVTITLPSGDSLRLRGTSAGWRGVISTVGSGGRIRLLLRVTEAPGSLGPPIDLAFYWQRVTAPLALATYPLTDSSQVGVLFQVRARIGLWVPDSGFVTLTSADTAVLQGSFRARLRPVYAAIDSLPPLLITGTFRARREVLPPQTAP
jgi:hypothetical protein